MSSAVPSVLLVILQDAAHVIDALRANGAVVEVPAGPGAPAVADSRNQQLLSCRAAAERAGLSPRSFQRMVAAGGPVQPVSIPGLRHRRFRAADIDAWRESMDPGAIAAGA